MKQLYVGTALNNILAFPIEDVLRMKVSTQVGVQDYKPKIQKKSTKNMLQKSTSNQLMKELEEDVGKIRFDLNESDEDYDDEKIH